MSKVGRKPIDISNVQVEIKGQDVHYKGSKSSGVYTLPVELVAKIENGNLSIVPAQKITKKTERNINRVWGLHRALLSNSLQGAHVGFEKQIKINGLGYKAVMSGSKVVFTLGFSHKIDFELPKGVSLDIDRSGQLLTFKSSDKALVGHVCSSVRAFRPPEPYKGTGIKLVDEVIRRKAGKTKAS